MWRAAPGAWAQGTRALCRPWHPAGSASRWARETCGPVWSSRSLPRASTSSGLLTGRALKATRRRLPGLGGMASARTRPRARMPWTRTGKRPPAITSPPSTPTASTMRWPSSTRGRPTSKRCVPTTSGGHLSACTQTQLVRQAVLLRTRNGAHSSSSTPSLPQPPSRMRSTRPTGGWRTTTTEGSPALGQPVPSQSRPQRPPPSVKLSSPACARSACPSSSSSCTRSCSTRLASTPTKPTPHGRSTTLLSS
mmetsp:Transcript_3834/g.10784  ORF Transcript_3834/g.10784 Transcript_3834/m.10784 type:complete len:251 (-) Transcript_3834:747-1499(-)